MTEHQEAPRKHVDLKTRLLLIYLAFELSLFDYFFYEQPSNTIE